MASLEQKIQTVIEETKKKDSFIQTYIMGKKLPQKDQDFVREFVKQYELKMGSSKTLNEKFQDESS